MLAISIAICASLITPLQGNDSVPTPPPFREVPTERPTDHELHGVWESRGYGWIADVDTTGGRVYAHSPAGTLLDANDSGGYLLGAHYYIQGDALHITSLPGSSSILTFDRIPALPPSHLTPPATDPIACFDYFWALMDHHYAYFDVRGVDWKAQRELHRPRVTLETTESDLWEILCDTLQDFNDVHISMV
ncbi:MAG: carboxyl-terminal processing protease [Planctomycetota bacterium]|jgi:carboxyl-terminal processing protease